MNFLLEYVRGFVQLCYNKIAMLFEAREDVKMIRLENKNLSVEISEAGAEIKRVYHLKHGIDYMWNGNPDFWGRTAPVLFPIVGRVVDDTYLVEGQAYSLSQHGFARDLTFDVLSRTDQEVWFELKSTTETLKKYPFEFSLKIGYELQDETVTVKWQVDNLNEQVMPFSIGAHPAFSTKLQPDDQTSDYYLHLETNEGVETFLFDRDSGLMSEEKVELIDNLKLLPLNAELFAEYPTLILEGETGLTLKAYDHDYEVHVAFDGFPYVGIWSPINQEGEIAPFVCIEPWYGLTDTVTDPQDLHTKKGIQRINPRESFLTEYSLTFK